VDRLRRELIDLSPTSCYVHNILNWGNKPSSYFIKKYYFKDLLFLEEWGQA